MNHLAVIVMSVTGQDFIESAKTGAVIFYSDFPLFAIMSSVDGAVYFAGLLFTTLIPTLGAYLIGNALGLHPIFVNFAMIPIALISLLVSMAFLSTFSESMNSLFVFYALEMKLVEYGFKPPPVSQYNIQSADQLVMSDLSRLTPK